MLGNIPIFITARAYNDEIFNINKECLKYAYIFIKENNLFGQTYIISDQQKMIDYAKDLGFSNLILHKCKSVQEIMFLEYLATYTYGKENDYYPDWIIILNINQLFRSNSLISNCIRYINDNYDIIASYTEISNKSHFFIHHNNIVNKDTLTHILSSEADRRKMIDSAIYAVKSKFAFECMNYPDPSEHFWKASKIKYFRNESLYTDIYDLNDLKRVKNAYKILTKVDEEFNNNDEKS